MSFSHTFKNAPHEYHNGGLWPMITGFYVADLAQRGNHDAARRFANGIHEANARTIDGESWQFPEYLHGQTCEPGGNTQMGWNAAAAVIAHHALEGRYLFRVADRE